MSAGIAVRVYRAASLAAADAAAAAAGVATTELMRQAGEAVAAAALAAWPRAQRVLVACGPGNNGGDGFVAAQVLAELGLHVTVAELRPGAERGDAAWARRRLIDADTAVAWWRAEPDTSPPVAEHDLVIDALFGTGLRRPLDGAAARWVQAIEDADRPVLSVDVPSGVDADRARPPGPHVRATRTLQLAGAVPASLLAPARSAFGAWEVADIGIPAELLEAHADGAVVDDAWLGRHAPRRAEDDHKYRAGTVLIVGGSRRYAGAAELAARGAYRAGAGLVTLVTDVRSPGGWPEVVWEPPLPDEAPHACVRRVVAGEDGARRAAAAIVGPGLEADGAEVARIVASLPGPLALDAGGLQAGARAAVRDHGRVVMTPHAGEARRLLAALAADLGGAAPDPADEPIDAALALARAWAAVCVLKGAGTVIADAHGRWCISTSGTPDLATGGSGDVLAGVIAAFLAAAVARDGADADVWAPAAAAVHLHGLAGARAGERGPGVVASDVAEALREALARHG